MPPPRLTNKGAVMVPGWVDQNRNPDLYTRGLGVGAGPQLTRPGAMNPAVSDLIASRAEWATTPGQRPFVYQRSMQLQLTANVAPIPIVPLRTEVDTIVFNVISTAAASVFWGNSSAVTVATGLEIQPGIPIALGPDNTREQWELQRQLEYIAHMMALERGQEPFPAYRAPRVVFDASQIFVVAAAPQAINIMLFVPPELQ